jgi:hypothetical protein
MAEVQGDPFAAEGDEEFSQDIPVGASIGGNIIPDGMYVGKLIEITKETAASGNPMYVLDFALTGPPEAGPALGKELRYWVPITPNTQRMIYNTFRALGLDVKEGETLKFKKSEVLNRGVALKVAKSTYNNQERSKIMDVRPHPSGAGFKYETGGDGFQPGTPAAPSTPPAAVAADGQKPKLPAFN